MLLWSGRKSNGTFINLESVGRKNKKVGYEKAKF